MASCVQNAQPCSVRPLTEAKAAALFRRGLSRSRRGKRGKRKQSDAGSALVERRWGGAHEPQLPGTRSLALTGRLGGLHKHKYRHGAGSARVDPTWFAFTAFMSGKHEARKTGAVQPPRQKLCGPEKFRNITRFHDKTHTDHTTEVQYSATAQHRNGLWNVSVVQGPLNVATDL